MLSETDAAYLAGIIDGEGSITVHRHTRKPDNRKPAGDWYLSGKDAQDVLRRTIPYLGIKKDRAQIVLDLPMVGYGNGSDEARAKYEVAKDRLNVLNRRGRDSAPLRCSTNLALN